MISKRTAIAACLLALAACNKMPGPEKGEGTPSPIRIEPVITRATATSFENNDAIGLTITRASGVYAANKKFTYNGLEFASDLDWYEDVSDPATLAAYYPYADATPSSFSVALDQSSGLASSDLIASYKENVLPTANAVTMPFTHRLVKVVFDVYNKSDYTLDGLVVKGAAPKAALAADFTATGSGAAADIKAFKSGQSTYEVILPPQTASLTLALTTSGKEMEAKLAEATLEPGKKYTVSVAVGESTMKILLSAEIEDWLNGGEIGPEPGGEEDAFVENLADGWITYSGVRYEVVKLKDGKWWMARNLRYLPEGMTLCSDITNVAGGVYAPLRVKDDATGLEFATDEETIDANGYLYQAEVALGLKVGDLTTIAAAEALAGSQGVCPQGWHIPTIEDIIGLVGKAVSPIATNSQAPYYDGNNGSIVLLNADGFNVDAYGAVTVQDNTKTTASFMGWASGYPNKISSCMICGSTLSGVSYNNKDDESSGIKNFQFYGFMPMTNKATEAEYTCNGTKVSYRIAGPVRCVRNEG